jgi:hypothetical protein
MDARIKKSTASAEISSRLPFVLEAGSGPMAQNRTEVRDCANPAFLDDLSGTANTRVEAVV